MTTAIVDTGCANISSVKFACEREGHRPIVTRNAKAIRSAKRVILPGVGAAPRALSKLGDTGLIPTLRALSQPVLGICLGMQLLFETLEEGGETLPGLGLIPGSVRKLDTGNLPSPHMGWNRLEWEVDNPILGGLNPGSHAYFVHSFAAPVSDATVAKTVYGQAFSAMVCHENVYGCQFHPERSSATGATILRNFLGLGA